MSPDVIRSRVYDRSGGGSGVDIVIEVDVNRPVEELWAEMADFRRFATLHPLYHGIVVKGNVKPGAELTIVGIGSTRSGKLLTWREGAGYSFSSLSPKDALAGFPHVYDYSVERREEGIARLTVSIRGKWSSRWRPRRAGLAWLRLISRIHARKLRAALARR